MAKNIGPIVAQSSPDSPGGLGDLLKSEERRLFLLVGRVVDIRLCNLRSGHEWEGLYHHFRPSQSREQPRMKYPTMSGDEVTDLYEWIDVCTKYKTW